jgi:putative iron-regulated protein
MNQRSLWITASVTAALVAAAPAAAEPVDSAAVLETYADIAHAGYEDSWTAARTLLQAIEVLAAAPGPDTLRAARAAWLAARVPYQQTEVYRFGNPVVDDWEGRVNAWPLDEGLIDYVDASYGTQSDENAFYAVNVIANPILLVDGAEIDATEITPALLSEQLQEAGEVEANVATGYHAIEFLLWGQDLNGTGPGAGDRPATDFDPARCTGGNCARRLDYLRAAADLLVGDLAEMTGLWADGGAAREAVVGGAPEEGLAAMLTGMGSLSYGELAGERMRLGLMLHDPEEEHDCFSDNTHNSHLNDAVGIRNVYMGRYRRIDGSAVEGASLNDLLAAKDTALAAELADKIDETLSAMDALRDRAERVEAYDQMIGAGNDAGNAVVQAAIDALVAQTRSIERAIAALGLGTIELEGSDSLDDPEAVFQ